MYKIKYAIQLIKVMWSERANAGCRAKRKRIDRCMNDWASSQRRAAA